MDFKIKTYRRAPIIGVVGVLMLVVVISGCTGNETTDKSSSITDSITNAFSGSTDIEDILDNPDSYIGKTVTVVGKPFDGIDRMTAYGLSKEESIRNDNNIAILTNDYPKEKLYCIKELSVTGEVYKKDKTGTGLPNEIGIREKSRKIISLDKKLC